jgi:hypothetical protein
MDFTSDIKGRGLLASVTIAQWTARKLDKKASAATAQAAGADVGRGRYHKTLIDPALLKPIADVATAARDYHESVTVPWTYTGVAMLPGSRAIEYTDKMSEFDVAFASEVDKFVSNYPLAVTTAARALGSLFDISEYPNTLVVRGKFSFGYTLSMLPDTAVEDFRVDIPPTVRDRIRADVQKQYAGMVDNTLEMLRERVAHLHERLTAYSAAQGTDERSTFRTSTVDGFVNAVHLAAAANITDHAGLRNACDVLVPLVQASTFKVDTLRADAKVRAGTVAALSAAMAQIAA